jgi:hypothetical protein
MFWKDIPPSHQAGLPGSITQKMLSWFTFSEVDIVWFIPTAPSNCVVG